MPGPLIAAVAGGLGSSLIGGISANRAAKTQANSADDQLRLQADMFNRTDELQGELYKEQSWDVKNALGQATRTARNEFAGNTWQADKLRDSGLTGARDTRDANLRTLWDDRNRSLQDVRDTRGQNISDFRGAQRDTLGRIDQTQRQGVSELTGARDRAIGNFDPYLSQGKNALGAYSSNLGLGEAPAGYSGLTLSPGAQFQLEQGRKTTEGGAASRGMLDSGSTLAEMERLRNGAVAMDRDNQQGQLFALAGMGQGAANSVAGLESGFAGDINDVRQTGSRDYANARGQYTDAITGQRNTSTTQANALRGLYAPQITGERSAYNANTYGIGADYANARTGANSMFADRATGAWQNYISNIGNARSQRANLYGSAAAQYAGAGSTALGNRGDAGAAGAIGVGNALNGGIGNALSIYSLMGGGFGAPAGTGGQQAPWSNPFAGWGAAR